MPQIFLERQQRIDVIPEIVGNILIDNIHRCCQHQSCCRTVYEMSHFYPPVIACFIHIRNVAKTGPVFYITLYRIRIDWCFKSVD